MNGAVPRDPALPRKGPGGNGHAKMAFATLLKTCVTTMGFAFVGNLQPIRREGRRQFFANTLGSRHLFLLAPFTLPVRRLN